MRDASVVDGVARLTKAEIVDLCNDGRVVVLTDDGNSRACERLLDALPQLELGQRVLCWLPESSMGAELGVVLGRIGLESGSAERVRDELVIKAKKNLTLKCGDGSITIRDDGKILIKGKDLVSHAQRMNRIKGGSVSIN